MAHHIQPQRVASLLRANWQAAVFIAVMAMLLVMVLLRIRIGINPDSLWLDDQWVASLVLHASLRDLLELMPTAPIGFLLLLQVITSTLGAGHWQMQLLPMLCGVAQIPLLGWIALRTTGRLSLGVLAATLLSTSSTFLIYTLRVKQYTLEGLIALILIALALACAQRAQRIPFVLVVLAAVLAIPMSLTAIPVGMVIVNVLALHLLLTANEQAEQDWGRLARMKVIIGCAAYNVVVLGWLYLVQFNQANDAMFEFWSMYYAPVHDGAALIEFSRTHLVRFFTGGLPSLLGWLAWAIPIGMALLCWKRRLRLIFLALLLFYGGMFTLSAMEMYPLGARRTDLFSFPITILAIIAGIWAMSRYISFLPQLVLIIVIGRMLLFVPSGDIRYPETADRSTVETLVQFARAEDGIVIGPQSSWAVGCYAHWPVELVRTQRSTNGFLVQPLRRRTVVLQERSSMEIAQLEESERAQLLGAILDEAPPRIWLLSIHRLAGWVPEVLESHGYTLRDSSPKSRHLLLFDRGAPAPSRRSDAS